MSASLPPLRRILVVDGEPQIHRLVRVLLGEGYQIVGADSVPQALARVHETPFDVVLAEEELGELSGIDLLRKLRRQTPDLAVIMLSGGARLRSAVEAMRLGAFDYLRKTVGAAELRSAVERAAQHGSLTREVHRLRGEVERARGLGNIVGNSLIMRQLLSLAERVANSDATVLILGESGTGKELLSRIIHRLGPRADKAFVAFDCSALAPTLLETELFGHEKGAFTGAGRARRGLFREAHGGTILLDEIGDIAPSVQNKLLRVLQEREIKPVGGDQVIPVDVRIIAATNKDLKAAVQRGDFREDLYWRLAVMPMQVPPLRDRRDDIPLLVAHILAKRSGAAKNFAGDESKYPSKVSPRALLKLQGYHWPGNIRELENVLSRAAILCDGQEIHTTDLEGAGLLVEGAVAPEPILPEIKTLEGRSLKELVDTTIQAVEREAISRALKKSDGSATKAAKLLGISRATIYNKLNAYGLRN